MTSDPERSEAVTSNCNRPQFGDFPTIEFVGADVDVAIHTAGDRTVVDVEVPEADGVTA